MKKQNNSLMSLFRLSNKLYRFKIPILPGLICRVIRVVFSCDLNPQTKIGEGTVFAHNGLGCVIHEEAIIGNNCKILQHVSIGGRNNRGIPIIEDDVFIGVGACVLGGIIIGKGTKIGANSVVINDTPPFSTIVGIPAKIVAR